jgi:hypothetical protein
MNILNFLLLSLFFESNSHTNVDLKNVEKNIKIISNEINECKSYSFILYQLKEGSQLIATNEKDILEVLEAANNIQINNNKKGYIEFTQGKNLKFSNNEFTLEAEGEKIVGRKNGTFTSMFSKKFPLKDYPGVHIFLQKIFTLDTIDFHVINNKNNKNTYAVVFYTKKSSKPIKNFVVLYVQNNLITHVLISMLGKYQIAKIEEKDNHKILSIKN